MANELSWFYGPDFVSFYVALRLLREKKYWKLTNSKVMEKNVLAVL